MLQQTQVKTVMPYWKRWMREVADRPSRWPAPVPEKIHKLWEGLGYYTRVRNLQKAARIIVAKHDGKFPDDFDDVLALPGIGRYTAGAICSIAFNQPAARFSTATSSASLRVSSESQKIPARTRPTLSFGNWPNNSSDKPPLLNLAPPAPRLTPRILINPSWNWAH